MNLRALPLAVVAAMAFTAFAGSSASATTLEVGGVPRNSSVTIEASIKSGTSALLTDTAGFFANTCTSSTLKTTTGSPFTGHTVTATTSNLTYLVCTRFISIHKAGVVHLTFLSPTTARVRFSQTQWTLDSPFGTLTCNAASGEGTEVGVLTGVAKTTEHATLDISAALNCGSITVKWTGTYTVTSPTGLGVTL